jgi:hypothetical protein
MLQRVKLGKPQEKADNTNIENLLVQTILALHVTVLAVM